MRLRQRVILNRQCHIAAEQFEGVEFAVFVERVAGTTAKTDYSCEASTGFATAPGI